MQIKAVLFDLGGTLIKTAAIPQIYSRILKAHGITISQSEILRAHSANEKEVDVDKGQAELGEAFWKMWNLKILKKLNISQNVDVLAAKIDELWWDNADLEFYPDVTKTISQLKTRNIKTGIVTNGLRKDFERILQKLKATELFDVVVGVDTCRKAKPDKEIFTYALDKLGVRPEETIFIGDSLEKDYEGARKAGLKPMLIDREGKNQANAETISNLTALLSRI